MALVVVLRALVDFSEFFELHAFGICYGSVPSCLFLNIRWDETNTGQKR